MTTQVGITIVLKAPQAARAMIYDRSSACVVFKWLHLLQKNRKLAVITTYLTGKVVHGV